MRLRFFAVTVFAFGLLGCGGGGGAPPQEVQKVQEKVFDENQKFSIGNSGAENLTEHLKSLPPAERAKEIRNYASAEGPRRTYMATFKAFENDKDPEVAAAAKEAISTPAPDAPK